MFSFCLFVSTNLPTQKLPSQAHKYSKVPLRVGFDLGTKVIAENKAGQIATFGELTTEWEFFLNVLVYVFLKENIQK
jgi:hypothetical protein